jgi:hypothetical protein
MGSARDRYSSSEVQAQGDEGEADERCRVFEYQQTRNPICFRFSRELLKHADLVRNLTRKIMVNTHPRYILARLELIWGSVDAWWEGVAFHDQF